MSTLLALGGDAVLRLSELSLHVLKGTAVRWPRGGPRALTEWYVPHHRLVRWGGVATTRVCKLLLAAGGVPRPGQPVNPVGDREGPSCGEDDEEAAGADMPDGSSSSASVS